MDFGMPTLIEVEAIEAGGRLCRSLGLDFIELNMNLPEYQADYMDINLLRRVAEEQGIYYTIHLDEKLNPCDFNGRVAGAYTQTVVKTIENAALLGAPVLNMHLNEGVYFTLPREKVYLYDEYLDEYLGKMADFRDICTEAIGGKNIMITLENTGGFGRAPFMGKALDVLLESPKFALCFDIGHNATAALPDEAKILQHQDRLTHLHIHDADGTANHLAFGEGELDIEKYLSLAKANNCRCVVEVKSVDGLCRSVEWLKEKGYL